MVRFVVVVGLMVVVAACADAGGAPCVAVWSSGTVCNIGSEAQQDIEGSSATRSSDTDFANGNEVTP